MLTDKACKNAPPKDKIYRLADSGGMYLEVHPTGAKYWRVKYRVKKREKRLALGVYPQVSLGEAREMRDAAKKRLKAGNDPSNTDRSEKFRAVAKEWFEVNKERWSKDHADSIWKRLEADILPDLGEDRIGSISPAMVLKPVRKIEERGAREIAHRALQTISQIFRYGLATEKCRQNPAAELVSALKPVKKGHFAAFEARDLPDFLSALEKNDARLFADTRRAIRLIMLLFTRTSELIEARKAEFGAQWEIPPERMKMTRAHIVPLSTQAQALIKEQMDAHPSSDYLFPNVTGDGHMSDNTILFGIYRLGYKGRMTGHGFRALAMSTIKEVLGYRHEVVDRQLAHVPNNKVDRAYDRAKFLPERKRMMQEWADYIDAIPRP